MAIVYKHIYNVDYNSEINNQLWEVRIYRRYDDTSTPSWVSDDIVNLTTFKTSTAKIDWVRRNDMYQAILGSKFDFSLVNEANEFINMSYGDYREFRVDIINLVPKDLLSSAQLRHFTFVQVNLDDNRYYGQLYWRGYIIPTASEEPLLPHPFEVSFRAVDGLAELGERIMPSTSYLYTTQGRMTLSQVVQYILQQTGLNLRLLIRSGIIYDTTEPNDEGYAINTSEVSTFDALVNSNVANDSFIGRKLTDVLAGILRAFNCKVLQSGGCWYIVNSSLQSSYRNDQVINKRIIWTASEINETNRYVSAGNLAEGDNILLRTINAKDDDLFIINDNFKQHLMTPLKSVECKPKDLRTTNLIRNPNFRTKDNWHPFRESLDQTLIYTRDRTPNYEPLLGPSLYTNRVLEEVKSEKDVWVVGNTIRDLLKDRDFAVSLDATGFINPDVVAQDDDAERAEFYGQIQIPFSVSVYIDDGLRYYYNFTTQNWRRSVGIVSNRKQPLDFIIDSFDDHAQRLTFQPTKEQGSFQFHSASANIKVVGTKLDETLPNDRFIATIHIWYPLADPNIVNFNLNTNTDFANIFLTNVNMRVDLPDSIINPTFTRLQSVFRRKYSYEPFIVSESDRSVSQKIRANTILGGTLQPDEVRLYREHTFEEIEVAGSTETARRDVNASLEQIVTQLRLNDFRRGAQTFQGEFSTLRRGFPYMPIQMIAIDYTNWKSGRLVAKAEPTLFWGGSVNLNNGIYMVNTFTPFQIDDVAKVKRNELNLEDLDENGQLKPGYYTNTKTAFAELERVVQIESDETIPLSLLPSTWFRYESEQNGQISSLGTAVYTPLQGNRALTDGRMKLTGYLYVGSHRFFVDDFGGNIDIDIPDFIRWDVINNRIIHTQEHSQTIHTLASLRLQVYISNMYLDSTIENLTIICENYNVNINPQINVEGYTEERICEYVTSILDGVDPISGNALEFGEFSGAIDNDLRFVVGTKKIKYNYNRFYLSLHALPIASDGMTLGDPTLVAQAPFFLTNDGEIGRQTSLDVCLPVDTGSKVGSENIDISYSPTAISGRGSGNVISGTTTVTITGLTDLSRLDFEAQGTLFMTAFDISTRVLTVSIFRSSFPSDKTEIQREIFPRIDGIRQIRLARPLFAALRIDRLVLELDKYFVTQTLAPNDGVQERVEITQLVGLNISDLSTTIIGLVGVSVSIVSESGKNYIDIVFDASDVNTPANQAGSINVVGSTTIEGFDSDTTQVIRVNFVITR